MCKLLRAADMVHALGDTRTLTYLPSTGVHSFGQEGRARARAEAPADNRGRTPARTWHVILCGTVRFGSTGCHPAQTSAPETDSYRVLSERTNGGVL